MTSKAKTETRPKGEGGENDLGQRQSKKKQVETKKAQEDISTKRERV